MSPARRTLLLAAAAVVIAGITVLAGASWMFFKRPLTVDAHLSRQKLKKAGMVERRLQGPAGPMTYWEGGSGSTLVLLHGAGDQAGAWANVVPALLGGGHRLLIPDQPGHWKSEPRTGPIRVPQILGGLEALMEAAGGDEPAVLVGNSMGAWMAMLYAREHPERVDRVVAVNGGPLTNPNSAANIFPATREEARTTMKALLGPDSPMPPDFVLDDVVRHAASGPARRFAETAPKMVEWVLDGRLDEVTVPVELVWGTADELMSLDYAQRLLDGLPRARLSRLDDCGHIPMRECPGLLQETILRVLASPPPEPTPTPTPDDPPEPAEEAS